MRFSTHQHKHYGGSDLPARTMYVCNVDQAGSLLVHKHGAATPEALSRVVAPYRQELVVAVEGIFTCW